MYATFQYHEVNTILLPHFTGEKTKAQRGLVVHVHTATQVNRQLLFHGVAGDTEKPQVQGVYSGIRCDSA